MSMKEVIVEDYKLSIIYINKHVKRDQKNNTVM